MTLKGPAPVDAGRGMEPIEALGGLEDRNATYGSALGLHVQHAVGTGRRLPADIFADDGYYAVVPEWVLDADISAQAVRLYALLRRYADQRERTGHPSRKTLAKRMHVADEKVIDRAIADLVRVGAIETWARYRDEENGISRQKTEQFNTRTSNGFTILRAPGWGLQNPHPLPSQTPTVEAEKGEELQLVKPQPLNPHSARKRSPEVPLPASWVPNESHNERAKEKGLDVSQEAEVFRAHADAHERRARRWDAAFTQWLIKARPKQGRREAEAQAQMDRFKAMDDQFTVQGSMF